MVLSANIPYIVFIEKYNYNIWGGGEPTATLDVSVQAQIILLLQELGDQFKMTYLFISHDLALVDYFCQRIIVMYLGKIVEITPANLSHRKPRHPYTRVLMESVYIAIPWQRPRYPVLKEKCPVFLTSPKGAPLRTVVHMPGTSAEQNCPNCWKLCRVNLWPVIFF